MKRLVVKLGTESLSLSTIENEEERKLDPAIFSDIARQIVKVQEEKSTEVVIVSSGAIRAGRERARELGININLLNKKELAALGAEPLLNKWNSAFKKHGTAVGQILVTYANWKVGNERESIKSSILNLLRAKLIPLLNENDPVAQEEIQWMEEGISENDRLAREIAFLIEADWILFLTDKDGVYEDNPETNPSARLYREISAWIDLDRINDISKGTSKYGKGGMNAKLREACECKRGGIAKVAIANSREKDVIIKFAEGKPVGTEVRVRNIF